MRRFILLRDHDVSGVSGTGLIAEGIAFSSGRAVLTWLGPLSSTTLHDSVATLIAIHGHGGATRLVWVDEEHSNFALVATKSDVVLDREG